MGQAGIETLDITEGNVKKKKKKIIHTHAHKYSLPSSKAVWNKQGKEQADRSKPSYFLIYTILDI